MTTSKRSLRKTATALAAVTAGLALTLTGCAGAGGDSSAGGGTLTIAINGEPQSLDPAKNGADFQQVVQWLSYEPLIRMNSDGTFSPALAESWEYVGDDNTVFEMTLRDGAKFADGTPVTVDDVVQTIEYYVATPSVMHSTIDDLASVEAVDEDTVRVTYDAPTPILPYVFSQAAQYGNVISAAGLADPEKLATATFGAGAYVLDASATVSGDRYTFVKNDEYWNPDVQQYDKFVVRVIGDPQTAVSALTTGQIDVNTNTTPTQVPDAESTEGVEIVSGTPVSLVVWLVDREGQVTPAIGDEKVRQALNYAIDREAIAEALGPLYAPLNQLIPAGGVGSDPALDDAYAFDIDKAKQLLDEAGYGDGFTLAFATNTDNRGAEVSQVLVEQWAKIGVTAELTVFNNQPGEMFGALADGKTAAQTFGFTANLLTQQSLLTRQSVFNPFGLSSTAVDDAYAALLAAPEADVDAAAQQVSSAISEEAWFVPVAAVDSFVFYKAIADFGGIGADGARVLDVLNWSPAS